MHLKTCSFLLLFDPVSKIQCPRYKVFGNLGSLLGQSCISLGLQFVKLFEEKCCAISFLKSFFALNPLYLGHRRVKVEGNQPLFCGFPFLQFGVKFFWLEVFIRGKIHRGTRRCFVESSCSLFAHPPQGSEHWQHIADSTGNSSECLIKSIMLGSIAKNCSNTCRMDYWNTPQQIAKPEENKCWEFRFFIDLLRRVGFQISEPHVSSKHLLSLQNSKCSKYTGCVIVSSTHRLPIPFIDSCPCQIIIPGQTLVWALFEKFKDILGHNVGLR